TPSAVHTMTLVANSTSVSECIDPARHNAAVTGSTHLANSFEIAETSLPNGPRITAITDKRTKRIQGAMNQLPGIRFQRKSPLISRNVAHNVRDKAIATLVESQAVGHPSVRPP